MSFSGRTLPGLNGCLGKLTDLVNHWIDGISEPEKVRLTDLHQSLKRYMVAIPPLSLDGALPPALVQRLQIAVDDFDHQLDRCVTAKAGDDFRGRLEEAHTFMVTSLGPLLAGFIGFVVTIRVDTKDLAEKILNMKARVDEALGEVDVRIGDADNSLTNMNLVLKQFGKQQDLAKDAFDATQAAAKQAKDIVDQLNRDKGKLTIATFAQKFQEKGEKHLKDARIWLNCTIAGVLVAACVVASVYWLLWGNENYSAIALRVSVLVFTYLGILWCSRNYRSHRHLAAVYEQKALSLSTFDAFDTKAEGNDKAKEAILAHVANAIFTPAVTGYLGPEENIPTPAADVVRSITGGK